MDLIEGQKVKLNLKRIQNHPDYPILTRRYRKFVRNNKYTVFTVEYDKRRKTKNPSVCCFVEDESKWLFSKYDLILIKETEYGVEEIPFLQS